jgi:hypothetical protein
MIRSCETLGCGTLTLGRLCLGCERERGIEFPVFVWQVVSSSSADAAAAPGQLPLPGFAPNVARTVGGGTFVAEAASPI